MHGRKNIKFINTLESLLKCDKTVRTSGELLQSYAAQRRKY